MDLGVIIERIQQLPVTVQAKLFKNLKLSDIQYTSAGAVLVALQLLSILGISRTIDQLLGEEHTTIESLKADYDLGLRPIPSTGMVLSLLIADMLAYPKDLIRIYKVEDMAHMWQTGPLLGICPTLLNDDRILRALSKLGNVSTVMEETLHLLIVHTAQRYGIPLNRFFMDNSLLELDGEFAKAAKVTLGRGRESLSQLIIGLTCAADSRIPVTFAVHAGNTNDAATLPSAFAALERVAEPGPIELIMDRGFLTTDNIAFLQAQDHDCKIISPLKTEKAGAKFKDLVDQIYAEDGWKTINYRSEQDVKQKLERTYAAYETQWVFLHKIKPDLEPGQTRRPKGSIVQTEIPVRCVVYRNGRKAEQDKVNRFRQRQRCEDAFAELSGKLNKRNLRTAEACQQKGQEVLRHFPAVSAFVNMNFETNDHGAVVFSWSWDETALVQQEKYDGIFALVTTHPVASVSANELLKRYRSRNEVEMDFNGLKGILDLEQVFVQRPERIDAYIFLKILAYFVLAFLRWYIEQYGKKKVTENDVQDTLSKMGICLQELLPLHIPHWSVSTETGLNKWLQEQFDIPDPHEVINRLNRLVNKDEFILRWLENNLEEVCLE